MSYDDRQAVGDELTTYYKSDTSDTLTTDAKPYQKEDSSAFVNELHSLAGSEVDLFEMPSSLQGHYSKYFSDQNKTVQANIDFNQNIDSQIASIKSQKEQLDADSEELRQLSDCASTLSKRICNRTFIMGILIPTTRT